MTTRRSRRWRSATVASAAAAAMLLAGCSVAGSGEDGSARPAASVTGPAVGLAEEVPASLAFVDQSVAPSTGTIAAGSGTVGVHSAPDRLYTRLGEIRPGATVGLTGNRAGMEDQEWAEIIWGNGTAWIPTTVLAS